MPKSAAPQGKGPDASLPQATGHTTATGDRTDVEQYFGTGYFHLYRNFLLPTEQTRAEAEFLIDELDPRAGQRWLDMPCGYGRHMVELTALAPELTLIGGDLNRQYLNVPDLTAGLNVLACDMRQMPLADGSFDCLLNLLNSFGYYPPRGKSGLDDRATLTEFARVLKPGGRLVMDLSNRRALIDLVRRQSVIRYCGGGYEAVEEFQWDRREQCLINRTTWRWPEGQEEAGYRLRLYTPGQIQRLLERNHFAIEEIYGDFGGDAFDPWDSDRMLIIARKD